MCQCETTRFLNLVSIKADFGLTSKFWTNSTLTSCMSNHQGKLKFSIHYPFKTVCIACIHLNRIRQMRPTYLRVLFLTKTLIKLNNIIKMFLHKSVYAVHLFILESNLAG